MQKHEKGERGGMLADVSCYNQKVNTNINNFKKTITSEAELSVFSVSILLSEITDISLLDSDLNILNITAGFRSKYIIYHC